MVLPYRVLFYEVMYDGVVLKFALSYLRVVNS